MVKKEKIIIKRQHLKDLAKASSTKCPICNGEPLDLEVEHLRAENNELRNKLNKATADNNDLTQSKKTRVKSQALCSMRFSK